MRSVRDAFVRRLSRPYAARIVVVASLVLLSPTLVTGLTADDHFHALVLGSERTLDVVPDRWLDLYVWADGDAARAHEMMQIGMTGWWTDPHVRMAYLRPISALTHVLDHALWPGSPFLMHLHSLAWFGLALVLLAQVYRRLAPPAAGPWVAVLALLLYGVDDAHAMTVGWIANRNALVALSGGLGVLLLHERAARTASRSAALLAALLFVVALLAGEAALATCGYLFAYALFVDPRGQRRGLVACAPYAAVVVAWAAAYRTFGYGASGSGLVVDPGAEPLRYLSLAVERIPILLLGQFGFPPSDGWVLYPVVAEWLPDALLGHAFGTIFALGMAFAVLLRESPHARFWALGAVLACLPVAAQFPHDRLLLFIGVGASGLLAAFFERTWTRVAGSPPSLVRRMFEQPVGWVCVGLHLVLAPLWLPFRALAPADAAYMVDAVDAAIADTPGVTDTTVVLLNPPADYVGYVPTVRAASGRPRPRGLHWLATGASAVVVERLDETSLRVRPERGFLWLSSERMQRSLGNPFSVGDEVRFEMVTIRVTEVLPDGRPAEIIARFVAPLEDPRFVFRAWDTTQARAFVPPAVGARVELPALDYLALLPPYPGAGLLSAPARIR